MKVGIKELALASWLMFLVAVIATAQNVSPIETGNKLYSQQKYELAIREYERVAETDGQLYATAIYNIGVCHYELWHTEEAIEFYLRAIKLRHDNYSKASLALGIALEEQNRFDEAKEAYVQAIGTAAGGNSWAKFKLALLEARDGNLKLAASLFKDASAHPGEHTAPSHNNLGVMLARLGRLHEAEKEFRIALQQTSGNYAEAIHNLQLCRSLRETAANVERADDLRLSLPTFFR